MSPLALALALASSWQPARATGGHFAVDDAAILDPGQCEVDIWVEREQRRDRTLLHLGPACRAGGFEISAGLERNHASGDGAATALVPQVKWATLISDRVSAGLVVAAYLEDTSPRHVGATLLVPVSWRLTRSMQLHVNVGLDVLRGESHQLRPGAAFEWSPAAKWLLLAEAFRQSHTNFARVGLRYEPSETLRFDLSRASGLGRSEAAWWTLGVTWAFERRRRGANPL